MDPSAGVDFVTPASTPAEISDIAPIRYKKRREWRESNPVLGKITKFDPTDALDEMNASEFAVFGEKSFHSRHSRRFSKVIYMNVISGCVAVPLLWCGR